MKSLDKIIGLALRAIAISCLVGLFALLLINVIARSFQLAGLAWFDEIAQGLFAWMVFTGAAALWREHDHFRVEWLDELFANTPMAIVLKIVVSLLSLGFLLVMTRYGWSLTKGSSAVTPLLNLPTSIFYFAIPFSGAIMCAYSVRDLIAAANGFRFVPSGVSNDI
ncbi:TRAP transporter small permease [Nitratireductor basaltis]|uniref:TRAP transporter small permease protein n=1 Tax=Nitratireductor basaltis TaxID=472175 RepID=A0A084U8U7_9HYPH|nr:TRAP transporter small permease [Nitratireductor basaltis]KFB09383.1 TRAP-type transport system, small permeasetransporter [Nitratireductor basaltis]